MISRFLTILLGLLISLQGFSQGKLLLVGGGEEQPNGWSDIPYKWAIEESFNQKVAILSTQYESPEFEAYLSDLGAVQIQSFYIKSQATANDSAIYDSLLGFDVLFIRGDDPWTVYNGFKNTLVEQAIKDKYKEGGVICASNAAVGLLSDIAFNEQNGNLIPLDGLSDIQNDRVRLSEGFLNAYEEFIFLPNFSKKNQLGNLTTFLAHQWINKNQNLIGIGLDEETALCVDSTGLAMTYGNGSVTVLLNDVSGESFQSSQGKPIIDLLRYNQLLAGDSFHFISWEVKGKASRLRPKENQETGNYELLMSGSNQLSENAAFLHKFIHGIGTPSDAIMIVTRPNNPAANALKAILQNDESVEQVFILETLSSTQNDAGINQQILASDKFLFTDNDPDSLFQYIDRGMNGPLLDSRIREKGALNGFIGDDSRLAGKIFVDNYLQENAVQTGHLILKKGLGLLSTTAVMANTFSKDNLQSHSINGLPYSMVLDSLSYGIWLSDGMYAHYYASERRTYLTSYGDVPLFLLNNPGAQSYIIPTFRDGSRSPNLAGFSDMFLTLIDSSAVPIGSVRPSGVGEIEVKDDWLTVYPNPVKESINIFFYGQQTGTYTFQLVNGEGRSIVAHSYALTPDLEVVKIPIPNLAPGVYMLWVRRDDQRVVKKVQVLH